MFNSMQKILQIFILLWRYRSQTLIIMADSLSTCLDGWPRTQRMTHNIRKQLAGVTQFFSTFVCVRVTSILIFL